MNLMGYLKPLAFGATLFAATNAFASDGPSTDYKAMQMDGKVIATNGKYSYVIDPSGLYNTITYSGMVQVKIYGTDIWMTINKNGETLVHKTPIKNMTFYVLAPLKDMDSGADNSVDYKKYALGYSTSSSLEYPTKFCTSCAAPTELDEKSSLIIKDFATAAKANEILTSNRKPGSS